MIEFRGREKVKNFLEKQTKHSEGERPMSKVKAAVLTGVKKIEMWDFERPEIPPDAILMKTDVAGVCGSDIHFYNGRGNLPLPVILGHEFVGTIVELGEQAINLEARGLSFEEGDKITVCPGTTGFCGTCYFCRFVPDRPNLCTARKVYGVTRSCKDPPHLFGGYSEYVYVDPVHWYVYKLPEEFPLELGALIEPMATSTRALERAFMPGLPGANEGFGLGKSVVVQGLGPIGLLAVAAAKIGGAGTVIGLDMIDARLKMAAKLGVDLIIDLRQLTKPEERIEAVKRATNGLGADVGIEAAGVPEAVPEGIEMVRDGGKYVEVGHYTDTGPAKVRPHRICRKDLDLLGSWAYPMTQFHTAIAVLHANKDIFPFGELITRKFKLTKAKEALTATGVVKAAITP